MSEVQRPKQRLSRRGHCMLRTHISPMVESTCTGLTRTRNSDFVLGLKFLQGQNLEAALVFLQRKEIHLS